jgi:hypothetical protein
MADSFVQVPPDSTGKTIDTRTESTNGNHREVVVIGDPSANAGVAPVDATNGLAVDNKTLPPGAATETTLAALNTKVTAVNTGAVVVSSSALPSGASTAAKQDTGNTSLSSIDTKLATAVTLDYDSGAGTQALQIVGMALPASGGAVAGGTSTNPLRVDVTGTTAQPITDNGGSLTVDGTVTATIAAGASTIAKAEDSPSASTDVGVPAMAIQLATPADTAGTDGDYAMLQMSGGRLWVDASGKTLTVASHAVTNAGTFAVQSTLQTGDNTAGRFKITDGTDVADVLDLTNSNPVAVAIVDTNGDQISSFGGGTQYTEDAAAAANPVGTALNLIRDDARGGSLTSTDGDNVAARGTNAGELYVKHVDTIAVTQSGTWDEVGINDSGNSITVDNGGTFAVQATIAAAATSIGKAEDAAHADGDVGVPALAVRDDTLNIRSGAENDYEPLHTDANGALWVHPTDSVAHDDADAGNPIKIGLKAVTAAPTAVAANDRANLIGDVWGRAYVRHGAQAPVASTWTQTHVPATNTQATKSQASAGSGKRNVCTGFTVTLAAGASAITAAAPLTVMVVDGSSGGTTYLWRSYINIPAVAGAQVSIVRTGLWLVGSQATAMTIEFSAAGGTNSYESVTMDGTIIEE